MRFGGVLSVLVILVLLLSLPSTAVRYYYETRGPGLCSSGALSSTEISTAIGNPLLTYENIRFIGAYMHTCRKMCDDISECIGYAAYPYNSALTTNALSDCWLFGAQGRVSQFLDSPGAIHSYPTGISFFNGSGPILFQSYGGVQYLVPNCAVKTNSIVLESPYITLGKGSLFNPAGSLDWYSTDVQIPPLLIDDSSTCKAMCDDIGSSCIGVTLNHANPLSSRTCRLLSTGNTGVTTDPAITSRFFDVRGTGVSFNNPGTMTQYKFYNLSTDGYVWTELKTTQYSTTKSPSFVYIPHGMGLCSPVPYNDSTLSTTFPYTAIGNVDPAQCQLFCDAISSCTGYGSMGLGSNYLLCWLYGGDFTGNAALGGLAPSSVVTNSVTGAFIDNPYNGPGSRQYCVEKSNVRPAYITYWQPYSGYKPGIKGDSSFAASTRVVIPLNGINACRSLCADIDDCNFFSYQSSASTCAVVSSKARYSLNDAIWRARNVIPASSVSSRANYNPDLIADATYYSEQRFTTLS